MPITRESFQSRIPAEPEVAGEELVEDVDGAPGAVEHSTRDSLEINELADRQKEDYQSHIGVDGGAKENLQGTDKNIAPSLPPADPTSAEKKDAFGAAYPQRETHRSIASGRDVPQFMEAPRQRESGEINWNEAGAQAEVYEHRARAQKDVATGHLTRIHDIVELLLEMSEAHSSDGERKLQSLEGKVAELETRYAVNRSSQ